MAGSEPLADVQGRIDNAFRRAMAGSESLADVQARIDNALRITAGRISGTITDAQVEEGAKLLVDMEKHPLRLAFTNDMRGQLETLRRNVYPSQSQSMAVAQLRKRAHELNAQLKAQSLAYKTCAHMGFYYEHDPLAEVMFNTEEARENLRWLTTHASNLSDEEKSTALNLIGICNRCIDDCAKIRHNYVACKVSQHVAPEHTPTELKQTEVDQEVENIRKCLLSVTTHKLYSDRF